MFPSNSTCGMDEWYWKSAEPIVYEWGMFCWTFTELGRTMKEEVTDGEPRLELAIFVGTSLVANKKISALLESFLLHARNLRDFLYKDNAAKDDVLAVHFFDQAEDWRKRRPPKGSYLESLRDRLNKALAHISYSRLKYRDDMRWNIAQIKHDIETPWEAFLLALPDDKRERIRNSIDL
ncbi:MAG: hypothetical protein ABIP48_04640 [Planctomycetota bacterium]